MVRLRFIWVGLAMVLLASACGDGGDGGAVVIDVPANAALSSPAPETSAAVGDGAETDDAAEYAPLDLSRLGGNASSAEVPSAIPAGLEMGFTPEGHPYRGSPDAAVALIEYSDYACPFCGRFTAQNTPALLEQYGLTGQVQFIFREFPLVSLHPTAPAGHAVAVCAGEQSAELYWAVHDEIFLRQAEWTNLPDPAQFFADLAAGVGVEMSGLTACLESGRPQDRIAADVAEAQQYGFNGTPSFRLVAADGEADYALVGALPLEQFTAALDAMLAGEVPPGTTATGQDPDSDSAGLPVWADRATGLQPNPDTPGLNQAGDQYKGDPSAPIVVIEFSDFQCPFCRDHALEVQPAIDEALVDTGQVMWVYKHLPLGIHPLAPIAGAAAECGFDQGRFWEMHHAVFEASAAWIEGDTEAELVAVAAGVGLDVDEFQTCLAGRDALERVLADQAEAAGIISSTPSFVVIDGERGALIEGSRPAEEFLEILEGYLAAAGGG
ncbi:MAG TPA: thioredoxin domain-containing protein [Acidimicrobiia bacterium]|jgi:protein-disulfide isomerase|nr:thioredoxin domain-containing protein [Acidimicrobiia bacterium]